MGYYSEGTLGVKKAIITHSALLENNLPELLGQMTKHTEVNEEIIYYSFVNWKMYDSYPEVQAFYRWLEWIENICSEEDYGYLEIGEDGDDTSHGSPHDFDIYKSVCLNSPIS